MQRTRFLDLRLSRLPAALGLCQGDTLQLANYVNASQERLITAKEAGDAGWYGSWAEVRYNVSRQSPYLTTDRHIARLELMDVCGNPLPLNNQFYEYMQFGAGREPHHWMNRGGYCGFWNNNISAYQRNNVVTFWDLLPGGRTVRIFAANNADLDGAHRVLLQGLDQNGSVVYSQDGTANVVGVFVILTSPFVDSPVQFSQITGIQKDVTAGPVQFFQVDSTGNQADLHYMDPGETTALYRRYYLNHLPPNCCWRGTTNPCQQPVLGPQFVQVSAMAKLELIPVTTDTDYTLIQSKEAIINECEAIRYMGMDNESAQMMAKSKHNDAIRLLIGEMTHRLGKNTPSVSFKPFGSADLRRQKIGYQI
jgi:hypothetical protein